MSAYSKYKELSCFQFRPTQRERLADLFISFALVICHDTRLLVSVSLRSLFRSAFFRSCIPFPACAVYFVGWEMVEWDRKNKGPEAKEPKRVPRRHLVYHVRCSVSRLCS